MQITKNFNCLKESFIKYVWATTTKTTMSKEVRKKTSNRTQNFPFISSIEMHTNNAPPKEKTSPRCTCIYEYSRHSNDETRICFASTARQCHIAIHYEMALLLSFWLECCRIDSFVFGVMRLFVCNFRFANATGFVSNTIFNDSELIWSGFYFCFHFQSSDQFFNLFQPFVLFVWNI